MGDGEEESTWEALPARKNRRTRLNHAAKEACDEEETVVSSALHKNAAQIEENIALRTRERESRSAHTTLDSKDGCAGRFYEYLDHTADVQCHSWGPSLAAAFAHMAACMTNYMTDLSLVAEDPALSRSLCVSGNDLHSLLYNYMAELLFLFSSENFCAARVEIVRFDREQCEIEARLHGEAFDLSRHSSGTEIKAITYSNMQIHEQPERVDLFVIVDI